MRWQSGIGHRDYPSEHVFDLWIDDDQGHHRRHKRQFQRWAVEMIVAQWETMVCEVEDIKGRTVVFEPNCVRGFTKEPNYDADENHHNYRDGHHPPEISEELSDADQQRVLTSMREWLRAHPKRDEP